VLIWYILPVLVYCGKKNLATLRKTVLFLIMRRIKNVQRRPFNAAFPWLEFNSLCFGGIRTQELELLLAVTFHLFCEVFFSSMYRVANTKLFSISLFCSFSRSENGLYPWIKPEYQQKRLFCSIFQFSFFFGIVFCVESPPPRLI
jgi:hypothetical protein